MKQKKSMKKSVKKDPKIVWKRIGSVGVDSGTLLVCDPFSLEQSKKKAVPGEATGVSLDGTELWDATSKTIDSSSFSVPFEIQKGRRDASKYPCAGVVFSSGFGDGAYPVIAKFEDFGLLGKRIVEVRILMNENGEERLMRSLLGAKR